MDQCPLCKSCVLVAPEKPCQLCGLTLIEVADDKIVAVIPGWYFFDDALPDQARSCLNQLLQVTMNVMLDLAEVRVFSSAAIDVLMSLDAAVNKTGAKLVLANVAPHVSRMLQVCSLGGIFPTADNVQRGLELF